MSNDPKNEINSLVTRYLSGELSRSEEDRFLDVVANDPGLSLQLEEYRKIWEAMGRISNYRFYDMDAEWERMRQKIRSRGRSKPFLAVVYRVAAVLLVGLMLAFAYYYSSQIAGTEVAESGPEQLEVILAEGTRVLLNRDSKLRYRKEINTQIRKVRLTGEAWFDISRDTLRPFVIDAGIALVEVLGTSFNVNAYRENPTVEITVESGMVALTAKQDLKEQIVMRAGTSGSYDPRSRELILEPVSDPNRISWKTRELFFENSPLGEVAELIGRVYHVRMEIANSELAACPITVSFRDQSLESVLNVLELTLDLRISRNGGTIVLEGEGCADH
jgi:ferric-dicitrate binding protein FerR (iron transport regulator)